MPWRMTGGRLRADTRGVSSAEYLSLVGFGALAVAASVAAFGGGVGGGLFAGVDATGGPAGGSDVRGGADSRVGGRNGALRDGAGSAAGGHDPSAGAGLPAAADGLGAATVLPSSGGGDDPTAAGDGAPAPTPRGGSSATTEPADRDGSRSGEGDARGQGTDPARGEDFTLGDAMGYLRPDALGFDEAPWPLPADRAEAAEIFAHYGVVPTAGDAGRMSDEALEAIIDHPDMPTQVRAAAIVEHNHRAKEAVDAVDAELAEATEPSEASSEQECSGWFSWCKVKQVAGGTAGFALGVLDGAGRALWETGKFVFKAAEYGLRLQFEATVGVAFGYTPTIDKVQGGIESFIDDPKGSLETGWEMAKAVGNHFVELGKSCSTEFTARGCGEAVGEIGFDVALTVGTGGVGGAAKGTAKLGAVASRHGARRTATALAYGERGLRAVDAGARATGRAALRGYVRLAGHRRRWNPVPGDNGVSFSFFANEGIDRWQRRWDRLYLKPEGDEFVIGTHGILGGRFVEAPLWRPRPGAPAKQRPWSHRELSRWMRSRGHERGQPIRLYACSTGADTACIAQDLANATGSRVTAPSGDISAAPGGMYSITNKGEWVDFYPGGRRSSVSLLEPRRPDPAAVRLETPALELAQDFHLAPGPDGNLKLLPGRELLPRPQPGPKGPLP